MYVVTDFKDAANTQQTNIVEMPTRTEKTECNRCKVTNANECVCKYIYIYIYARETATEWSRKKTPTFWRTRIIENLNTEGREETQKAEWKMAQPMITMEEWFGLLTTKETDSIFRSLYFYFPFNSFIQKPQKKIACIFFVGRMIRINNLSWSVFIHIWKYNFTPEFILSELDLHLIANRAFEFLFSDEIRK